MAHGKKRFANALLGCLYINIYPPLAPLFVPQPSTLVSSGFVGVWLGSEQCAEEFSRLNTDEYVVTNIFILVS